MIYKNGQPYQMSTPEGRAIYNAGVWQYEFDYKDHLGNTRVSFKANGANLEKTAETAFDPWGVRLNIGAVNAYQNRFEMQNHEKESTFGLNRINFGNRTQNPTTGRFDRIDLYASKYPSLSSFQYSANNPIRIIDINGDSLKITGVATEQFKNQVMSGTNGFYGVSTDMNGNISLNKTGLQRFLGNTELPAEVAAFVQTINEAIESKSNISIETVNADGTIDVGSIVDNKIDMADVAEFDKAGPRAGTSAGAIAHEVKEQQLKAEAGGVKGTYPAGAGLMHRNATRAENRTNGNVRVENQPVLNTDTFYEKDGSQTRQTVNPNTSTGVINIIKIKMP